jgi:hypothetical protein
MFRLPSGEHVGAVLVAALERRADFVSWSPDAEQRHQQAEPMDRLEPPRIEHHVASTRESGKPLGADERQFHDRVREVEQLE